MRVGILALLHESNTFISQPTHIEHFQQSWLYEGDEVRSQIASSHHEVGGFFAGLEDAGLDPVGVFAARATPYGTITAEAFRQVVDSLFAAMDRAIDEVGPLDGWLLAPHGATVSEVYPDADGHWLSRLRTRVGPAVPLIATLDPHGNLSPQMVEACDALIAYRSNPHLDQRARGREAARLMARTLRGDVRPTMAASLPPLAINIERQLTSEPQLRGLYQLADQMLAAPTVLSNSIMLGFPYADVAEMGSAAIVVTDRDLPLAQRLAAELGDYVWSHREEYVGQLIDLEAALDRAAELNGPICLLDMGDNVGGGSPGDSTFLAHAIHDRALPDSFVCLYDPQSVQQAIAAGPAKREPMALGGKTDQLHGPPLRDEFTVVSLHDGKFTEPEARHGGLTDCDQGPTAIVRSDKGLTVMLTSERMPPFSLQQLISCGIDPTAFRLLVAKGVNAPVAAYDPICPHLIRVNTDGCTTADMESLEFHHRRQPMFPFERAMEWTPAVVPPD
ncbi:MAG: hypothetical protein CMJ59_13410 [Planctomycetaceae bacterium]|nr:hypothetical protein [Planctomycetaceae bacterium]